MRTVETKPYKFDELSDEAKEVARGWYRENCLDYEWWDFIIEDAKTIAELMSIEIENVYFSGFSSQGDGACFEGSYSYAKGGVKAVKDHAPQDEELHRIATQLQALQRTCFYKLSARVKHSGHYNHERCTLISVCDDRHRWGDASEEVEEELAELLRDYMRWIYKQLEAEYDWMHEDEQVDESITANEYEFDEDGTKV